MIKEVISHITYILRFSSMNNCFHKSYKGSYQELEVCHPHIKFLLVYKNYFLLNLHVKKSLH